MNYTYSYVTDEELFNIVSNLYHSEDVYNSSNGKSKAQRIVPKIIIGGTAMMLTPAILLTSLVLYNKNRFNEAKRKLAASTYVSEVDSTIYASGNDNKAINEEEINKYLSTAEEYNKNGNVVDTYLSSDLCGYVYIYDMDYINLVYDDTNVTLDSLLVAIDQNNGIPREYKNLFHDYCYRLFATYNNIELRPFYENLKDLKVVECNKRELLLHTLDANSYGCYVRNENAIYVPENCNYEKGTWEYQVLFHEISHCLRTRITEIDGIQVRIQCEGLNFSNNITAECLNSLFTISLFDYNEDDIAYQLQSNYHRIMIDCMDNYDLSDYANHSVSYYANKLDEFNKEKGVAPIILELIQLQYDDYHNDHITIAQEEYYRIYDYIARMYFNKYITEDMSYEEMKNVVDKLVSMITFDVPEGYNIDVNHFYTYFEEYISEKGYTKTR